MARTLTKRKRNSGALYERPPEIDDALAKARQLDLRTILDHARIKDRKDANYLPPECLVALMRDAWQKGDRTHAEAFLPIIFARIERTLAWKIRDADAGAAEIREDILQEFGKRVAEDFDTENSTKLDFFECRFASALDKLCIDAQRRLTKGAKHERPIDPAPGKRTISDARFEKEFVEQLTSSLRGRFPFSKDLEAALDSLTPEEREIVVLEIVFDQDQKKIAKKFGVTERTVFNRRSKALEKLAEYMKEKQS